MKTIEDFARWIESNPDYKQDPNYDLLLKFFNNNALINGLQMIAEIWTRTEADNQQALVELKELYKLSQKTRETGAERDMILRALERDRIAHQNRITNSMIVAKVESAPKEDVSGAKVVPLRIVFKNLGKNENGTRTDK